MVMVAEDALFFLVLSTDTLTIGPFTFSAERNYAENVLMMACAAMTCWFALRQLDIHSNNAPLIRLATIYLVYAEAVTRSKGATPEVYNLMNELRARSFMAPIPPAAQTNKELLLDYILRDQDNQNIASSMSLSPSTVKVHVHNILQKTGHANRQERVQDFWKTV